MNPPKRDTATNDKQITLFWSPISSDQDTGGSAILSYGLEWDNGSSGNTWSAIMGYALTELGTNFIVSSVTPGKVYSFRM